MVSRSRALPAGFIAPCLPSKAPTAPSGELWLHEIKHDRFRVIASKLMAFSGSKTRVPLCLLPPAADIASRLLSTGTRYLDFDRRFTQPRRLRHRMGAAVPPRRSA